MFTGIIQSLGKIVKAGDYRLTVSIPFKKVELGESICLDGVCLTVASQSKSTATFDVGPETRRVTTLSDRRVGDEVNLERALRVGDRLGGHWVTGHVETIGTLKKIEKAADHWWVTLAIPKSLVPFVVDKGSLAVDGISLTVASVRGALVRLMIIPHTWSHTTLGKKFEGDRVNLEADILAKYVLKSKGIENPPV